MRNTIRTMLVAAATLTLATALHAQDAQQGDTTKHKPLTPKTVATATAKETQRAVKHTGAETKRVAKRTGKATKKAAHQTKMQAKRTHKQVDHALDKAKADTTKP